jgi:hypothetical protein
MNNTLEKVFKLSEITQIADVDVSKNVKLFNNIFESCSHTNAGDLLDRFQNDKSEDVRF